jgi:hypothetical protein
MEAADSSERLVTVKLHGVTYENTEILKSRSSFKSLKEKGQLKHVSYS